MELLLLLGIAGYGTGWLIFRAAMYIAAFAYVIHKLLGYDLPLVTIRDDARKHKTK